MQQSSHDTNMSHIDNCTIAIDIFCIGRTRVLVYGIHSLEPQKTSFESPWGHVQLRFFLSMNETKNPQHGDCGRSIPATHGGLNDSRLGGTSFHPPFVAGIDLPRHGVMNSYNLTLITPRGNVSTVKPDYNDHL